MLQMAKGEVGLVGKRMRPTRLCLRHQRSIRAESQGRQGELVCFGLFLDNVCVCVEVGAPMLVGKDVNATTLIS